MSPIRPKRDPRPTPEPTTPAPPVTPGPPPVPTDPGGPECPRGVPAGTVPRGNIAGGGPWGAITKWRPVTCREGAKHGVPWSMLEAMMVVESGGNANAVGAGGASGLMQVKPRDFESEGKRLGYNVYTPEGQIGIAAAILGGNTARSRGMDPETAFLNVYYPVRDKAGNLCLDCKGESGHTPRQYLADIAKYRAILEAAAGTTPAPQPEPEPEPAPKHPFDVLFGGAAWKRGDFRFRTKTAYSDYAYGVGHGTRASNEHTGLDLLAAYGTPYYALGPGTVACVGDDGRPVWDQGCGFFHDTGDGGPGARQVGVGNVTILYEFGGERVKVTTGHTRAAFVNTGDRVTPGQRIGTVGGMRGAHLHLDVVTERDGTYWLNDPEPTLLRLMGGAAPEPERPAYREVRVAGLAEPILLPADVPFRQQLTPRGPNRSGKPLAWRGIVHHETGNARAGADAAMHATWQANGTPGHPDGKVGVHFYADDREVVQTLPVDEQGVHAGDARNRSHVAVERCVNADGDRARAERHAQELEAALLRAQGWTAAAALEPHHLGSGCPAQTNAAGGWARWVQAVDARRATRGGAAPAPAKRFPVAIPDAAVTALFPYADPSPAGTITAAWVGKGMPPLVRRADGDDGWVYWVFTTIVLRSKDGVVEEVAA